MNMMRLLTTASLLTVGMSYLLSSDVPHRMPSGSQVPFGKGRHHLRMMTVDDWDRKVVIDHDKLFRDIQAGEDWFVRCIDPFLAECDDSKKDSFQTRVGMRLLTVHPIL